MRRALQKKEIGTPLGPMTAVGDEEALFLLQFSDKKGFEGQLKRLSQTLERPISSGNSPTLDLISGELEKYFKRQLEKFTVPIALFGTSFQQAVLSEIQKISLGKTAAYGEIAKSMNRKNSFRAVAGACGANPIVIVIPCHRVVCADKSLGGYSCSLFRKKWLLEHER